MMSNNRLKKHWRKWLILITVILFGALAIPDLVGTIAQAVSDDGTEVAAQPDVVQQADGEVTNQAWAFEERFDGDPDSPSQDLLPSSMNYVITHRTHPQEQFTKQYVVYPADHGPDCAGPNPDISPVPHHFVQTAHTSSNSNPDKSFYICKNHMMTAIGEVDPYSVSAFWPRQEFNFSDGGTLEFEVNMNDGHTVRHWWEIMIVPQDQIRLGAGPSDSPIDELYPEDRIVLEFRRLVRGIKVGTGGLDPEGWIVDEQERGQWDFRYWSAAYPDDPVLTDRRIRRTNRITLENNRIIWSIEKEDGTFDDYAVDVPGGLPFDQGIVMFKTHSYTPSKDNNVDTFTFHWDNVRFDGPVVGQQDVYDADNFVYLQRNGDRQVGESETVNINLPSVGANPVLIGQINQPKVGHVLLSINGRPDIAVDPLQYGNPGCNSHHWSTFRLELDPAWLQPGDNSLKWTIGPQPECSDYEINWIGYSVKALQIHMDRDGAPPPPLPTVTPVPPATETPLPLPTATTQPLPTATNEPLPTATSQPLPTATAQPQPTATVGSNPPFNESIEAEGAILFGPLIRNGRGASGGQFVDFVNPSGDFIEWTVDVPSAGRYEVDVAYQAGRLSNRPLALSVNEVMVNEALDFPPTGSWARWDSTFFPVDLNAGSNTIRLTATGSGGPNIDFITVANE